jgi:hypothetical protein
MATSISIASNALVLIGDNPISSFTEAGTGAQAAANLYPNAYEQALSEHPWSFATKEAVLSRLSAVPDTRTGFKYAFQLPSDMIRLWKIMDDGHYAIVNGLLYSSLESLMARYVYKVNESELPAHFVSGLQYRLAADFALLVTESPSKSQIFEGKAAKAFAKARTIDSQQSPSIPIQDRPFTDVRGSGRYI